MHLEPEQMLVIAMFASFIVLLFTGFPVAWVLAGVGIAFAGIGYLTDNVWQTTATGLDYNTLGLVVGRIFSIMDNWVLVALPMFIFMGLMLDKSGVAERMMHSMQKLFGRVRGGLAVTVTLIGIILAASTGIIGASVVLLGVMSLPVMLNQDYHKPLALGTVASAGCLGILIPPSIMLVIMGDQLGISVGDLFMGAVLPGLILGMLYVAYIVIYGRLKPDNAPLAVDFDTIKLRDVGRVMLDIVPPALLILAVLGSIFMGIATVTEASGIGALGAALLAIAYRRLDFQVLKEVTFNTMNTSAYIFAIFLGATVFALVLRELGGDELIKSALTGLGLGPYGLIAAVLAMVFLLGFFPGLDRDQPDHPAPAGACGHRAGPGHQRLRRGGQPRTGLVRPAGGGDPANLIPHAPGGFCPVLPERGLPRGCQAHGHLSGCGAFYPAAVAGAAAGVLLPGDSHLATVRRLRLTRI